MLRTFLGAALIATITGAAHCCVQAGEAKFASTRPGHVFVAETGVVRLALSGGKAAGGEIVVTDENERELFKVAVPAGADAVKVELPTRGFYALSASVTWEGAGGDAKPTVVKATSAVTGVALEEAVRRASPFGFFAVTSDDLLERGAGAGRARGFMATNGVTREQADSIASGQWMPPPKPLPSWWAKPTRLPQYMSVALMGPPAWTMADDVKGKAKPTVYFPPKDWDGFKNALEYSLLTMSMPFTEFEILNEPDANWRGTDAELVQLLAATREVQKRVRPEAKLLAPCSYGIRIEYLQRLAELGMFDHIDGLVVHNYAGDAPPEGDWYDKLLAVRAWLKQWDREHFPLYITEYGWQTAKGDWARPVTIRDQGYFAARGAILMRTIDPVAMNYFCLGWRGTKNPIHNGWAVTEENSQPRPAYAALANVYRMLADCRGPGRVLRPAPDTWMAVFRRADGRAVAAAWTLGAERKLTLPEGVTADAGTVRGMTGRPAVLDADGRVPIGPGVTFFELSDDTWLKAEMGEMVTATPGSGAKLDAPLGDAWSMGVVSAGGEGVVVPGDAPAGDYLLLGKMGGALRWQPVRVLPPWAVSSATVTWPASAPEPVVEMVLTSNGKTRKLRPSVKIDRGADRFAPAVEVAPGKPQTVKVTLPGLNDGREYTLRAEAEYEGGGATTELRERFIAAPRTNGRHGRIDWKRSPVTTSADWFTVTGTPLAPEDCSARLQAAWSDEGVHLRIEVRDDVHRQKQEDDRLWAEDALQIAFDTDNDQPWRPNLNNDVDGFNGHRIFEYAVGMREDGKAAWSRARKEVVRLEPADEKIKADIVREGDVTRYEITFPWASLGQKKAMAAGRPLGFSLLVNDADEARQRKGLALFGGIFDDKDPKYYGRLWLRP